MSKTLTKANELGLEIKKLNGEVRDIHDLVDEKQDGIPTADQKAEVVKRNIRIEELEKQFAETDEWRKSREQADARGEILDDVKDALHPSDLKNLNRAMREQQKSLGDQVLEDEQFKAFVDSIVVGSRARTGVFGSSPAVQVKGLVTGASSTSAGALVVNDRKPMVDPGLFYRELTVMDLIGRGTTGSDTVEYVREGTHTNAAAGVAEATGSGDGTGTKPESSMVLAIVTETVKTIAHWIPASRNALADAGQMRTLIEAFLRYGLREIINDQIYDGAGGNDLTGIVNTSGTTAQAFDTDILTTYRKARTKVKTTGRARPTAYLMHPNDWEDLDLLTDNEAGYYYGGPSALGVPRLWGLPVAEDEGVTEGLPICAAFNLAMYWDRQMEQIYITDSHSDFFVRNLIAILAETRAAFGLIRPAAFVEIALS